MEVKVINSEVSSFRKELIHFIRYHASQIKQGGWSILIRKLRKFLAMLLFLPLTLPGVLIVRALRPLVLIRLYPFNSERIGNFALFTEMYLCWRDAGLDNRRAYDIFYYNAPVSNLQLKKMWDRTLHVCPLAGPVDTLNRTLPGGRSHIIPPQQFYDRDVEGLMSRTPVHLSFTSEEERLGQEKLLALGIPDGTPFVCFHSRDSAYLESTFPSEDLQFHDYRDSSVHNHIPAAEEMTRRGYYAIRMGAVVKEPLQTTNPQIIDYATNHRDDFMDIYLCAKCYFYIGDNAGIYVVPWLFRKPVAHVNSIPVGTIHTQSPDSLYIFKKLWLREEGRFLTFPEIFERWFDSLVRAEQYEQYGIEPVENTPEEITALAVEMDERLKGTWQATEEDEKLQQRFWSLFKSSIKEQHGVIASRIGADFLRRNRELLD